MKTGKEIKNYRHKMVDLYKLSVGCELCGYKKHPSALCFDHLPDTVKAEAVKNGYSKKPCAGGMYRLYHRSFSIDDLINEIKKCRVVCSNCHMELTHSKNDRGTFRAEINLFDLEAALRFFEFV